MKVCFVNSNPFWGGAEKWHVQAASYLAGRGHEICFFARTEEVAGPAREAGLDVKLLPFRSDLDPGTLLSLTKSFRKLRPDALILNSERDLRLGGPAGSIAGVKVRVRRKGITGVKSNSRYRWMYRNLATHTLCVSEAVKNELARLGWLEPDSMRVIYTGVDLSEFKPEGSRDFRDELGLTEDEVLVGNLSRLSSIKGLDYLIRTVQGVRERHPHARFALVGTGRVEGELKALASELGADDALAFPGFRTDAPDILRSFDIVAHPSVSTEGFPNSIVEAMACGKPVIGSEIAGIPEGVIHGKTGLLVSPRDEGSLMEAICGLISDVDLRREMGKAAREDAERRFDFRKQMAGLEQWLVEITSR